MDNRRIKKSGRWDIFDEWQKMTSSSHWELKYQEPLRAHSRACVGERVFLSQ